MKNLQILHIVMLLIGFTLASCEDDSATHPTQTPQAVAPIKAHHGATLGAPVSKTIGPEGGELQMPDARIRLTIPAGAVEAPTNFSIQQVENTFPGAKANSYRLLPEGVEFSKPVTLTFSYEGADLSGSDADFLYLTYQDAEGYYHLAKNTYLHKESKTLTVETTHFSDWTYFQNFLLVAENNSLNKGESTELTVKYYIDYCLACGEEDPKFGEWVDDKDAGTRYEWSVNYGGGTVKATKQGSATYTAPTTSPDVNPVGVGVRLSNFDPIINKNDPGRTQRGNNVLMLQTEIHIQGEQLLEYTFNGTTLRNTGDYISGSISIDGRNKFSLRSYINGNKTLDIIIFDTNKTGLGVGSYAFGSSEKGNFAGIRLVTGHADENKSYTTSYSVCDANGCGHTTVYSSGSVKITKWGPVGSYVEGEVSANLYRSGEFNPPALPFSAKFKAIREL